MTQRYIRSLFWILLGLFASSPAAAQTLEGFATFPADTFAPGPTSGQFILPANGRIPPFVDKQPVQGSFVGAGRARKRFLGHAGQRVRQRRRPRPITC